MSKLSKEDFDEYLGKESFYSERDKERFFNKNTGPEKRRKSWFPRVASALVIVGAFVLAFQLFDEEGSPPSPNRTAEINEDRMPGQERIVADSMKEVNDYYRTRIRGLERAEKLGLVKQIDKDISITDESTLTIDRIWYNSQGIYLLYSIGVPEGIDLKNINSADNAFRPSISSVYVNSDTNDAFSGQSLTQGFTGGPGVIYNDRIYKHVRIRPIMDEHHEPLQRFDGKIAADITLDYFDGDAKLLETSIPIRFNLANEPVVSVPINQEIKKHGYTISLDRAEIRLTGTYLYGKMSSPTHDSISRMKAKLIAEHENGKTVPLSFSLPVNTNGDFKLTLPTLKQIPVSFKFHVDKIDYIAAKESIEFSLDVRKFENIQSQADSSQPVKKEVHRKVGSIKNTTIYLENLYYDEYGLSVELLYSPQEQLPFGLITTSPNQSKQTTTVNYKIPHLITVINEDDAEGSIVPINLREDTKMGFSLESDYVKSSKQIDIKIENLLYELKFGESITFPVEAK